MGTMDEVEAIKTVSSALESLEKDAQARVLMWASARFGVATPISDPVLPPNLKAHDGHVPSKPIATAASSPKGKSGKKAKTIISMDKTLNLSPSGKESAVTFSAAKAPSNVMEKCVVAVYYLRDIIELEKVSTQGVFTFFKTAQWPVPTDLKNTLQQAGTKGWLDTADSEDIKLTSLGENLVEHNLPKKPKAA